MRSIPARKYVKRGGRLSFRRLGRSFMNVGRKALKIGQGILDKMDEAGEFLTKHQKKIILAATIIYCRKNPDKCTPEYIGEYIDDISRKRARAPVQGVAEEVKEQLGVKELREAVSNAVSNIPKEDLDCAKKKIGITDSTNNVEAFFSILAFLKGELVRGKYQGYAQTLGIPIGQVSGAIQDAVKYIHDACREIYEDKYLKALINYDYVSSKEPYREAIFARLSQDQPLSQSEYLALQKWYNAATKDNQGRVKSALPESTDKLMKEVYGVGGVSFDSIKKFGTKLVKKLPNPKTLAAIAGAIIGAGLTIDAIASIPAEGYVEINAMQEYMKKNRGASLLDYAKSGEAGSLSEGHERYMKNEWRRYWQIATVLLTINPNGIKMNPQIAMLLQKFRRGGAQGGTADNVRLLYALKNTLQVLGPDTSKEQIRTLRDALERASDDELVRNITDGLNDMLEFKGVDAQLYGQLVDRVRKLVTIVEKFFTDTFDPQDTRHIWSMGGSSSGVGRGGVLNSATVSEINDEIDKVLIPIENRLLLNGEYPTPIGNSAWNRNAASQARVLLDNFISYYDAKELPQGPIYDSLLDYFSELVHFNEQNLARTEEGLVDHTNEKNEILNKIKRALNELKREIMQQVWSDAR